jgi:4,5-DOPA dioxygenase extradiol
MKLFASAGVLAETACRTNDKKTMAPNPSPEASRMPVLFLAHGAPVLMDDEGWVSELHGWARALPKPKSVLMISAHWEKRPTTYGATTTVPLYYDFYGFPEKYYEVKYPAPGAPALAKRVEELLGARGTPVAQKPERGLDHGAYVPLLCMYPEANVPVLQLSLPSLDPKELHAMGRTLAPLRDEGVLIIGSGFLTHNMRFAFRPGTPQWATEFDQWAEETLSKRDDDGLMNFMSRAPAAAMALPTTEHFVPVIVAAGAAEGSTNVRFPITGFWGAAGGAFTRRSVEIT